MRTIYDIKITVQDEAYYSNVKKKLKSYEIVLKTILENLTKTFSSTCTSSRATNGMSEKTTSDNKTAIHLVKNRHSVAGICNFNKIIIAPSDEKLYRFFPILMNVSFLTKSIKQSLMSKK